MVLGTIKCVTLLPIPAAAAASPAQRGPDPEPRRCANSSVQLVIGRRGCSWLGFFLSPSPARRRRRRRRFDHLPETCELCSVANGCRFSGAWLSATVRSERHVFSSATRRTSSHPNTCPRSSITMPSRLCTSSQSGPVPRRTALHHGPVTSAPANRGRFPGSATSRTRWDCSIPPGKKTTTACGRSHTHRPTSSWCASASRRRPRSKTSARNGSPRCTTTAPASRA